MNTNVITGLGMCKVCTEAVDCVAFEQERYHRLGHVKSLSRGSRLCSTLNTNYITGLDMCKVCTEAADCVVFEHERYHRFGHV